MPFGIGGGAFGVRGGISTRGIGVGAGPFSAGTSWRGGSSGGSGGGGGLLAWLIGAAIVFFIAAWPFLLGTFIAVRLGAWNPSTERLVTGLCFEVVYVAALVGWFMYAREQRVARAGEEARRTAEVVASGVVYETTSWRSTVYRHGTCTVNHKSHDAALGCRKGGAPTDVADDTDATIAGDGSTSTASWMTRDSVRWPAAILAVGFAVALVVLLVDPIHSAAEDASSHACPSQSYASSSSATATVPDIVGANAADAETQLKSTGFTNVNLQSANPDYKSVWVASNWTVLSADPAPGCAVSRPTSITVYVTK